MKNFRYYVVFLLLSTLLFTFCSKDDKPGNDLSPDKASISFGALLNDLVSRKPDLKQALEDLPECSEGIPVYVEVALSQDGEWIVGDDENPLMVQLSPTPADYDGDGVDNYFTEASPDLELSPGTYTLEYFTVMDENGNTLWIAPRDLEGTDDYANFVENPLPLDISLGAGVKKYVDVDVLCYDNRMVNQYGYLFFDIEQSQVIDFCIFGNYCDENGRHFPAHFSADVWSYSGDPDNPRGEVLQNNIMNEVGMNNDGDYYADPLCLPLPDRSGEDQYYVEIRLMNSDAYEADARLIRSGVITDDDVRALFDGEDNADYYHFKYGYCNMEDVPMLFDEALPQFGELPVVEPLTDPFAWADGNGRSTDFGDWERRREEIKAEIEQYEIGTIPERPENITASYDNETLTVNVTVNGKTITLTSQVLLPSGNGPFPAVIGMNSPNGSIPSDIFTDNNVARIRYNHNQVTTYYNPQLSDPFFQLYPEHNLENTGQYSAWVWGVSRIIDGLELVQSSLPIDLDHIAVTGCSYAGKMALFAGAFDERIALTIAQESGGGGAPAWRVSETLGNVETLGRTSYDWFRDSMREFSSDVNRLPYDHHELMALVAPRALLVTGNTSFEWLANPSAYVSARAAREVYKEFGIADRLGFYIDGGHNHCAIPDTQRPAIEAFVEKFLLGNNGVNTDITVNPYPELDYERWYEWWGTNDPVLPPSS
ncbi:hypothetical protein RM553_16425 [Zunongwangia sp. F363]|uniref:4-O-methyl-glucuronoyl methylesterase-like domain-containing protein n=1 Tax=Autumnicola tepida TaxID=3075595 RepID=A0ABU3CDP1_9FLAO|nr:hypothetical protein [Zunongwangia sp. F363]MDT0644426.1 hypothetical protein [Zunongwangia sp. F363]